MVYAKLIPRIFYVELIGKTEHFCCFCCWEWLLAGWPYKCKVWTSRCQTTRPFGGASKHQLSITERNWRQKMKSRGGAVQRKLLDVQLLFGFSLPLGLTIFLKKVTPFNILGTGCGTYKKESGTITTEKLYYRREHWNSVFLQQRFMLNSLLLSFSVSFCRYIRFSLICVSWDLSLLNYLNCCSLLLWPSNNTFIYSLSTSVKGYLFVTHLSSFY